MMHERATPETDAAVLAVPDASITAAEGQRGQVKQLQAAIQALYAGLEIVGNHARRLERQRDGLADALRDVFALIDEGWLVRNTKDDEKDGFAMRQLQCVQRLAKAALALNGKTEQ